MNRSELLMMLPTNSIGVELGVYNGDFSEEILKTVNPKILYLVDVWKNIDLGYNDKLMVNDKKQLRRYREVTKKFLDESRVRIIRDYTTCIEEIFSSGSLDWSYIDADHSYKGCLRDLEASDLVVKESGFILGHDYEPASNFGVIEAVNEFVKNKNYYLSLITSEKKCPSFLISKTLESHQLILDRYSKFLDKKT